MRVIKRDGPLHHEPVISRKLMVVAGVFVIFYRLARRRQRPVQMLRKRYRHYAVPH